MTWHIVSMQKPIPKINNYGHNYVALVNDAGQIIEEFHGFYSDPSPAGFTINATIPGDFLVTLRRPSGDVMGTVQNNQLGQANTIPILLANGTHANGIAVNLLSGDEATVEAAWNAGINAVNTALAGGKFLYLGATINPFGHAINSNSVWWTFLLSIGILNPGSYNGPGIIPGHDIDLRTEPSHS